MASAARPTAAPVCLTGAHYSMYVAGTTARTKGRFRSDAQRVARSLILFLFSSQVRCTSDFVQRTCFRAEAAVDVVGTRYSSGFRVTNGKSRKRLSRHKSR